MRKITKKEIKEAIAKFNRATAAAHHAYCKQDKRYEKIIDAYHDNHDPYLTKKDIIDAIYNELS